MYARRDVRGLKRQGSRERGIQEQGMHGNVSERYASFLYVTAPYYSGRPGLSTAPLEKCWREQTSTAWFSQAQALSVMVHRNEDFDFPAAASKYGAALDEASRDERNEHDIPELGEFYVAQDFTPVVDGCGGL